MGVLLSSFLVFCYFIHCHCNDECGSTRRLQCRNLRAAQECGVYDNCLKTWENSRWESFSTDLSAKCTYCLHVMGNSSTADITTLCDTADNSPSGRLRCVNFVSSWGSNVSNKGNALAICNLLALCESHTFIGDLDFGSAVCEDCKKIFQDIRNLVADNATAVAIGDKLNELLCMNLPENFRRYCDETIRAHIPAILHMIEVSISPQDMCALLNLCPKSPSMVVSLSDLLPLRISSGVDTAVTHTKCKETAQFSWINRPSAKDHPKWTSRSRPDFASGLSSHKPSCDQCKAVLEQIRAMLNDPVLNEKIKRDINEKVCSILPSFLRQACTAAVSEHFNTIIDSLNHADLTDVCSTFGMCVPNSEDCVSSRSKQIMLQPGVPLPGVCRLCEIIAGRVIQMLLNNATEKSIADALQNVCFIVPETYKSQCTVFVKEFGAKIIKIVIEGTAPVVACNLLGLCDPITESMDIISPPQPMKDSYCDLCKIFVTVLQHQLQQNQTTDMLESLIDRLCDTLPASYDSECKNLVHLYLPTVLGYLSKSMTPEEICQEIRLCPSLQHIQQIETTGGMCETLSPAAVCRNFELATMCGKMEMCLIYHRAQYVLMNTHPGQQHNLGTPRNCTICSHLVQHWRQLKKLFNQVVVNGRTCQRYVVQSDRDLCQLVVDNRFKIYTRLLDTASSEEICHGFGLCNVITRDPAINPVTPETDATETLILACNSDYRQLCSSNRLVKLCDKVNVCRALGYHTAESEQRRPVDVFGSDACSWGATYYCQTEKRARSCGNVALEHCQKHVWLGQTPVKRTHNAQLGENRCTQGPAYWCASEDNARSCGPQAMHHCRLRFLLRLPTNV